jgi:tetratricopeptide (TPR) repeat protein
MIAARLREFEIERQAWDLNNRIEKTYNEATDHLSARRWAQAITKFDEVLRLNPQNERARRGKRDAYLGQADEQRRAGQLTEAIGSLESARQLYPNDQEITRALQDTRSRIGQEQRRAEAQRVYNQGQIALSARRWNDAIVRFNEAIGLDPEFQPARQGLKEAYLGQGRTQLAAEQWDEAIKSLEEALRIAGADPDTMKKLLGRGVPLRGFLFTRQEAGGPEVARLWQEAWTGKYYVAGTTALAAKQWG